MVLFYILISYRKPKRINASYTSDWREQNWFDISHEIKKSDNKKNQHYGKNPKRLQPSRLQNQGMSNFSNS